MTLQRIYCTENNKTHFIRRIIQFDLRNLIMPLLSVNMNAARVALTMHTTMAVANSFLIPQIDLQIFDNILQLNSVKANVVHGCNVLQSMLHMHAVIDGNLAWKGNRTDVSRNAILDVLDDIKATHMEQPHALQFCFNLCNSFILLMDNADMHTSHFYGDFCGFMLSFAFYKDMADIYTKLKARCVDPQTMIERNIEIIDVDLKPTEGEKLRSTYRKNLTKSTMIPTWTNPKCRKYKYVAISKAMTQLKRKRTKEFYTFTAYGTIVSIPKFVVDDDWENATNIWEGELEEDPVDTLYGWFDRFNTYYLENKALWEQVGNNFVFCGIDTAPEFAEFEELIGYYDDLIDDDSIEGIPPVKRAKRETDAPKKGKAGVQN